MGMPSHHSPTCTYCMCGLQSLKKCTVPAHAHVAIHSKLPPTYWAYCPMHHRRKKMSSHLSAHSCADVVLEVSYLGALLGDDRHGRAADVAGAHAADLHVPVVAHGCFEEIYGGLRSTTSTNRLWRAEMMSGDISVVRRASSTVGAIRHRRNLTQIKWHAKTQNRTLC